MSLIIQRPPGVNVGVNNPGDAIYINGNESTDGSTRWIYAELQIRKNGIWVSAFIVDRPVGQFVFDGNGEQVTI